MSTRVGTALVLLLAFSACSRESGGMDQSGTRETYSLETVGSAPLPAVLSQDSVGRLELTAGSLTLNRDQTFSMTLTTREVIRGEEKTDTGSPSGTYVQNDTLITFTYSDGATEVATLKGSEITLNSSGFVLRFRR